MFSHMKTTLNIDETVFRELKTEAARQGRTMSDLVESALRMLLRVPNESRELPPLPCFSGGSYQVDIANRDQLFDRMESE